MSLLGFPLLPEDLDETLDFEESESEPDSESESEESDELVPLEAEESLDSILFLAGLSNHLG